MKQKNLIGIAAVLYGVLFLYSGGSKLVDLRGFRSRLEDSPLPIATIPLMVYGVPMLELLIVAALVAPRWRLAGLVAGVSLLVAFTGYLLYLISFPQIPCGCGGVLEQLRPGWHLLLNSGLILLAGLALRDKLRYKLIARNLPACNRKAGKR